MEACKAIILYFTFLLRHNSYIQAQKSSSILFSCTGTTLDLTPTIDTSQTIMFSHKQEATATVTASSVTPTTEAGPTPKGTSTNCQLKTFYSCIYCLWIFCEVDKWRFIVKKFNWLIYPYHLFPLHWIELHEFVSKNTILATTALWTKRAKQQLRLSLWRN